MRWMAMAALILGLPATLAAQGFELGGSISNGLHRRLQRILQRR